MLNVSCAEVDHFGWPEVHVGADVPVEGVYDLVVFSSVFAFLMAALPLRQDSPVSFDPETCSSSGIERPLNLMRHLDSAEMRSVRS
jgi:hypothetical protein